MKKCKKLNISKVESFSTLDGPGVRSVIFLQGCNLECKYCHNPETIDLKVKNEKEINLVYNQIAKNYPYIKENGGVSFSGGEPLIQASSLIEISRLFKKDNIHLVIETNGSIINEETKELIGLMDLVYIDLKMTNRKDYEFYIKGNLSQTLRFIEMVDSMKKKIIIRQVIIEGINDDIENIEFLKQIKRQYPYIIDIELLPFKKLCSDKYKQLNMYFYFEKWDETKDSTIDNLNKLLSSDCE